MQSCRATHAPVMAAVRVPPSAWMTSQSIEICRSPSFSQIDHGAQAAADQPLDLLGAARLLAGRRLAARALVGGARQHAVLGGDPAFAAALEPGRQALLEARRAQHVGVAELDQAGALGMHGDRALEGDAAKLVGFAFRWTHEGIVPVLEWCAEAVAGVDGPGRIVGRTYAGRPAGGKGIDRALDRAQCGAGCGRQHPAGVVASAGGSRISSADASSIQPPEHIVPTAAAGSSAAVLRSDGVEVIREYA